MNPETLLLLAEKNSADIEAIINTLGPKVGIPTLLTLMPHIVAILQTLQAQQPKTS